MSFSLVATHYKQTGKSPVASLIADQEVVRLIPARSHTFMEINNEIFSMVILHLPLIQEGLLSVTSESMCPTYRLIA